MTELAIAETFCSHSEIDDGWGDQKPLLPLELMGQIYESLTSDLQGWLAQQKLFFVATAPLGVQGHLNCSPKGADTFRILGEREVAYLDFTGSGIETAAHLQENERIIIMFCAF